MLLCWCAKAKKREPLDSTNDNYIGEKRKLCVNTERKKRKARENLLHNFFLISCLLKHKNLKQKDKIIEKDIKPAVLSTPEELSNQYS